MVFRSLNCVKFSFGDRSIKDINSLQIFLSKNNVVYDKIISAKQIHSNRILVVDSKFQGVYECDGLVTGEKGVVLTLYTADCMPIFFIDNVSNTIGVAHCGWRGTYQNISARMIERFYEMGSRIENIKVMIGPAIGPCCYAIFGQRYEEIMDNNAQWRNDIVQFYNGRAGLNLLRWNYLQLISCGVDRSQINYDIACTSCNKSKYYSYHRGDRHVRMFHFILNDKGV